MHALSPPNLIQANLRHGHDIRPVSLTAQLKSYSCALAASGVVAQVLDPASLLIQCNTGITSTETLPTNESLIAFAPAPAPPAPEAVAAAAAPTEAAAPGPGQVTDGLGTRRRLLDMQRRLLLVRNGHQP